MTEREVLLEICNRLNIEVYGAFKECEFIHIPLPSSENDLTIFFNEDGKVNTILN